MSATASIIWDLQSMLLKGGSDSEGDFKMLLHNSSPVVQLLSMYSNSLSVGFPSNTYRRMILSCSMFAESVTLLIWIPIIGPYGWLLWLPLDTFQNIILCSLEVYIVFPLLGSKGFLSVLSREFALNSNSSLTLPLLKLLVVLLSLCILKPIPYLS